MGRGEIFFFFNVTSAAPSASAVWFTPPFRGRLHSLPSWRHRLVHPMGKHSLSAQCLFSSIQLLKKALIYLGWGKQQKWSMPRRPEHLLYLSCAISPALQKDCAFLWQNLFEIPKVWKENKIVPTVPKFCLHRLFWNAPPEIQVAEERAKSANRHHTSAVEGWRTRTKDKTSFQCPRLIKDSEYKIGLMFYDRIFFDAVTAVLQLTIISLEYEQQLSSKEGPEQAQQWQGSVTEQSDHMPGCKGCLSRCNTALQSVKRQGQEKSGWKATRLIKSVTGSLSDCLIASVKQRRNEDRNDSQRTTSACAAIDSCKYLCLATLMRRSNSQEITVSTSLQSVRRNAPEIENKTAKM